MLVRIWGIRHEYALRNRKLLELRYVGTRYRKRYEYQYEPRTVVPSNTLPFCAKPTVVAQFGTVDLHDGYEQSTVRVLVVEATNDCALVHRSDRMGHERLRGCLFAFVYGAASKTDVAERRNKTQTRTCGCSRR
eukprot:scaffold455341_cov17-Prasinocladus_malaysianus.AAC.1